MKKLFTITLLFTALNCYAQEVGTGQDGLPRLNVDGNLRFHSIKIISNKDTTDINIFNKILADQKILDKYFNTEKVLSAQVIPNDNLIFDTIRDAEQSIFGGTYERGAILIIRDDYGTERNDIVFPSCVIRMSKEHYVLTCPTIRKGAREYFKNGEFYIYIDNEDVEKALTANND